MIPASGKLALYPLRYGCSIGGNTEHIAPEIHTAARHLSVMVEGSPAVAIDYDKQPVFDCAMCMYGLMTKNGTPLPHYPTNYTVSKVGGRCVVSVRFWVYVCR